jgi:CRISPR/Cas system Type II protein with McrA/HNH and RuvC-like nuclease domain
MRTLSFQYVTDVSGQKNAVLLNFKDWETIMKDLEELDRLKFFLGLKDAFDEAKQLKEGKKKPNSFKNLIDELS